MRRYDVSQSSHMLLVKSRYELAIELVKSRYVLAASIAAPAASLLLYLDGLKLLSNAGGTPREMNMRSSNKELLIIFFSQSPGLLQQV